MTANNHQGWASRERRNELAQRRQKIASMPQPTQTTPQVQQIARKAYEDYYTQLAMYFKAEVAKEHIYQGGKSSAVYSADYSDFLDQLGNGRSEETQGYIYDILAPTMLSIHEGEQLDTYIAQAKGQRDIAQRPVDPDPEPEVKIIERPEKIGGLLGWLRGE